MFSWCVLWRKSVTHKEKKKITERQTHPLAMGNESVAVICGFTHVKKENLHSHANFGAEMVFRKALGRDTVLRRKDYSKCLMTDSFKVSAGYIHVAFPPVRVCLEPGLSLGSVIQLTLSPLSPIGLSGPDLLYPRRNHRLHRGAAGEDSLVSSPRPTSYHPVTCVNKTRLLFLCSSIDQNKLCT